MTYHRFVKRTNRVRASSEWQNILNYYLLSKKGGEKMEKTKLEMDFLDGYNKRLRISIDEPLEGLVQSEIESAMDSIIAHNIFQSNGVDLVSREGARIIKTTVNEMEF